MNQILINANAEKMHYGTQKYNNVPSIVWVFNFLQVSRNHMRYANASYMPIGTLIILDANSPAIKYLFQLEKSHGSLLPLKAANVRLITHGIRRHIDVKEFALRIHIQRAFELKMIRANVPQMLNGIIIFKNVASLIVDKLLMLSQSSMRQNANVTQTLSGILSSTCV